MTKSFNDAIREQKQKIAKRKKSDNVAPKIINLKVIKPSLNDSSRKATIGLIDVTQASKTISLDLKS